jgi:hypothetical protein
MAKFLFLDDERFPAQVTWINLWRGEYEIVRSFDEFRDYIIKNGIPQVISFDHDLGMNSLDGHKCARWLADSFLYDGMVLPENFAFTVHSMNPIGARKITKLLDESIDFYENTVA